MRRVDGGLSSPALRMNGGAGLGSRGRERARERGETDAGLLPVLGRTRDGEPRLCAVLAMAAARWQPQNLVGVAWRGVKGSSAKGRAARR